MNVNKAIDDLNEEYQRKAKRDGFLGVGDAADALAATKDYALRGWLRDFILRWESTEAMEKYPETSEAAIFAAALVEILGMQRNGQIEQAHTVARNALRRALDLQSGRAQS